MTSTDNVNSPAVIPSNHPYLVYSPFSTDNPDNEKKVIREIVRELLRFYSGQDLSRTSWIKKGDLEIRTRVQAGGTDERCIRMGWKLLEEHITKNRAFLNESFHVQKPLDQLLDMDIGMAVQGISGTQYTFSGKLPMKMSLDRDGSMRVSPQTAIQNKILSLRSELVEKSYLFREEDWFSNLRTFVCDTVSLIDVTIHHVRILNEFQPMPSWAVYDGKALDKIGPRQGGKLNDKVKWVFHIANQTSPQFSPIENQTLDRIRQLRNHLIHWDPPNFCYTLENVADWLNSTPHIASILFQIRKMLKLSICEPLIKMLLAKKVKYNCLPGRSYPKQPATVGYASCLWPEKETPLPSRDNSEEKYGIKLSREQVKGLQKIANRQALATGKTSIPVQELLQRIVSEYLAQQPEPIAE